MRDDAESQDQELHQDQKALCMVSTTHSFLLSYLPYKLGNYSSLTLITLGDYIFQSFYNPGLYRLSDSPFHYLCRNPNLFLKGIRIFSFINIPFLSILKGVLQERRGQTSWQGL